MTLRFCEDRYDWNMRTRQFLLAEPPSLLGDRVSRVRVQEWRVSEGWNLLYTYRIDDPDGELGLIDIWSNAAVE